MKTRRRFLIKSPNRRKREEVVAREIEEIMGGESLEEIREEEEERLEWEREKQIREQLIEADRAKNQGQAALERKGKRGVAMSETERKDWDRQAVERQMALAEQREKHRIDERRVEDQGSGGDKQGIGGRIKFTGVVEEGDEEHGAREATIREKGSCFQLSSETDGSIGEGKLQKTVRMLEEKMKEMNDRICVLEGNSDGEEKEMSSSDGGYEKDWRWDNGGWWLRAPLIKGNRVNARYRRKISRMVKQMLNQEEKKGGRQKCEWENLRKEGEQRTIRKQATWRATITLRWTLVVISCLARVTSLNVRTGVSRTAIMSLGPAAVPGTWTGPARKRSC